MHDWFRDRQQFFSKEVLDHVLGREIVPGADEVIAMRASQLIKPPSTRPPAPSEEEQALPPSKKIQEHDALEDSFAVLRAAVFSVAENFHPQLVDLAIIHQTEEMALDDLEAWDLILAPGKPAPRLNHFQHFFFLRLCCANLSTNSPNLVSNVAAHC